MRFILFSFGKEWVNDRNVDFSMETWSKMIATQFIKQ